MIDPHGEYSAAFKGNGKLFDVNNLNLPYWLMNFREHCEVFVQSQGDERQMDCDIPRQMSACKQKRKVQAAAGVAKLTVDSPVPYLLSDLTTIIQNEMGKLDKSTNSAPYMRLKTKIDEIKSDPALQLYVLRHAGRRHDGRLPDQDFPPAVRRQTDLDHRRIGHAIGNYSDCCGSA